MEKDKLPCFSYVGLKVSVCHCTREAPEQTVPSLPTPRILLHSPAHPHAPSAEPEHLAALFSLIKCKCGSQHAGSSGLCLLTGDIHNALLLTVSETARSSILLHGWNPEKRQLSSAAGAMSLPFRKELEKYKNINEDEILSKLSEDELKQLEHVLDDLDPEVSSGGQKASSAEAVYYKCHTLQHFDLHCFRSGSIL